jgi:glucokinase
VDQVVVALDVGGTSIKAALIDELGTVELMTRRSTGVEFGAAAVVAGIVDLAAELAAHPDFDVRGIGVCVPGTVDAAAGIARYAANLGWGDTPFVALIRQRTGLPVTLAHDVRTAVLAEARRGAGAGTGSMFFLAIGTGIAGGLARDGVVDDGATGLSGEIGHLVVRPDGPPCHCGNRGCLEAIASASRISLRYAALTGADPSISAREIAERVRNGEQAAQQIWTEAVDALADALAAVTVLMDPGRFVVGGGLSLAGQLLTDPLETALARRLTFRPPPPISLSVLGDQAGVMGAAVRAWDHLVVEAGR